MTLWIQTSGPTRGWTPPRGLEHSRPREVRLSAGGATLVALGLLLAAGAVVGGVGLSLRASWDARDARRLELEGVPGEGLVTSLRQTRGESRKNWVTYRYHAGGK